MSPRVRTLSIHYIFFFILGVEAGLTRYKPKVMNDVLTWNFISRSLYSARESNPRKKMDVALVDGLNDVIREVSNCAEHFPIVYLYNIRFICLIIPTYIYSMKLLT